MKAFRLIILVFFLPAMAIADTQIPKISVTGVAKKTVTPDQMEWSLAITSKDKNLEVLSNQHVKISSKVLNSLKNLGIKKEDLKTSRMRFNEDWSYSGGKRFKDGFVARTNINFKFSDFSKYLSIWKKLSEFDEVAVNSANFSYSKHQETKDELKNQALINAKEKAQSMAKTLGVDVGQVLYLSEGVKQNKARRYNEASALASRSAKAEAPIEPGSTEVFSSVLVEFRIVN